jgi:hypothetical protein
MLRNIHGTNFYHIKFLGRTNIKCQNGPVLPPPQACFYFNCQALLTFFLMQRTRETRVRRTSSHVYHCYRNLYT